MRIYILIILTLAISSCLAKKGDSSSKANKVYESFQIIENKMQAHYDYIEKNGIFEDLIGHTIHFFKVVKTVAPHFLTDTKSYKDDILSLLTDKSFKRYHLIDYDIPYLLYNLPIDDYIDLLQSVVVLFKNGDIDQELFERFIFPDDFVSTSLYENYQNEKLQLFLNNLLKDEELIAKVEIQEPDQDLSFSERIYRLKKGTMWEGNNEHSGLKKRYVNRTTILDGLKVNIGY